MAKHPPHAFKDSVESASDTAFSNISDLREELESWYDNLPENFQSGDKGDQLQEAMGYLDSNQAPDVPECLGEVVVEYSLRHNRKPSRADRRDECLVIVDAVISACEVEKSLLEEMEFNEDGKLVDDDEVEVGPTKDDDGVEVEPMTEDERDSNVTEIEDYISELENAKSEWENCEFPGMFG